MDEINCRPFLTVGFLFPAGCKERYSSARLPALPRAGDFIRGPHPEDVKYRIAEVIFELPLAQLDSDRATIVVRLESISQRGI